MPFTHSMRPGRAERTVTSRCDPPCSVRPHRRAGQVGKNVFQEAERSPWEVEPVLRRSGRLHFLFSTSMKSLKSLISGLPGTFPRPRKEHNYVSAIWAGFCSDSAIDLRESKQILTFAPVWGEVLGKKMPKDTSHPDTSSYHRVRRCKRPSRMTIYI